MSGKILEIYVFKQKIAKFFIKVTFLILNFVSEKIKEKYFFSESLKKSFVFDFSYKILCQKKIKKNISKT